LLFCLFKNQVGQSAAVFERGQWRGGVREEGRRAQTPKQDQEENQGQIRRAFIIIIIIS
jgi:hypothetical protein